MSGEPLYTFVAGGALEQGVTFNVKCNCRGDAPITPTSVAGYGYSKRGKVVKIVDQLETTCLACGTTIKVSVLEGDPGYVLTMNNGRQSLHKPQGSTSKPVGELSVVEQQRIIDEMNKQ